MEMHFSDVSVCVVRVADPNSTSRILITALYIDGVMAEWPLKDIEELAQCLPTHAINTVSIEDILPSEIELD